MDTKNQTKLNLNINLTIWPLTNDISNTLLSKFGVTFRQCEVLVHDVLVVRLFEITIYLETVGTVKIETII